MKPGLLMDQRFTKEERLTSKILIGRLFAEGKKFYAFPFRVIFIPCRLPAEYPAQLLVSVPRSYFRRAADRNRIKRMIRESYRMNKAILYESLKEKNLQVALCIQYSTKEMVPFTVVREKIIVLLQRLSKENAEIAE